MITNTTATLYHDAGSGVWTRIPLGAVYWEACTRSTFLKTGVTGGDDALMLVPYGGDTGQSIRKGDLLVQGDCDAEITAQYRTGDLVREHHALRITTVELRMTGSPSMRHWEVGAKA